MAKDFENLTIQSLHAHNVARDPPYNATVANVWIPSDQVDLLSMMVGESDSILCQNNNGGIKKLMSLINSSFPLNSDSILSPIPTTSQISPSTSGLSLGAKIAFAVVVPIVAITLLVFSLFFRGRRRKTSQNKLGETNFKEKGTETRQLELATEAPRFELQVGDYDHELSTEGARQELQGDSRRRQELGGLECAQELEARSNRSEEREG